MPLDADVSPTDGTGEAPSLLKLRLLGPPQLTSADGAPLDSLLASPKRLALLAYLAVAGRRGMCSRDQVLGMFWPDSTTEAGRNALRQTLFQMRKSLGEGVIITRGDDRLGLDPDRLSCDVTTFERLLEDDRHEGALNLYDGDFLEGFFLSGAREFDEWLTSERARLRDLAAGAAWQASEDAERAGSLAGAAEWARGAVAFHPQDEAGIRRLMSLLDRSGNRSGAVQAYEEFARWLEAELELEPAPETRELVADIRARPDAVEVEEDAPYPPDSSAETPLGDAAPVPGSGTRVFLVGGGAVALLALLWTLVVGGLGPSPSLDANRIVVFPFVVSAEGEGSPLLGEDVSTWLGWAFEGSAPLQFIDGWQYLDAEERDDPRQLTSVRARGIATAQGAALHLSGRLLVRGDSAQVVAQLYDVVGDSVLSRSGEEGRADRYVEIALQAATALLPELIPVGTGMDLGSVLDRPPAAVASSLRGERAYRRAQFAEALDYYGRAVAEDSTFAFAALKGAQAASWNSAWMDANRLVAAALADRDLLSPRLRHFAVGLQQYLGGSADSAVVELRRAVEIDEGFRDAWMAMGEVHTHLLPRAGPPDSLAQAAFEEVHRLEPGFAPALFHLLEIEARRGHEVRVVDLLDQFRTAGPEPSKLLETAELIAACIRDPVTDISWTAEVGRHPQVVYDAAKSLSVGGARLDCAELGWTALLEADTTTDAWAVARRFGAVSGMQSLLVAQGREAELPMFFEEYMPWPDVPRGFYLQDVHAGAEVDSHAREAAEAFEAIIAAGTNPSAPPGPQVYSWFLSRWYADQGDVERLDATRDSLWAVARESGDRSVEIMARSADAQLAVLEGDADAALQVLTAIRPTAPRGTPWQPWESLGAEQLALARLLLERGDYLAAVEAGNGLDAATRPVNDLVYLRGSLELRLRAAEALGDVGLVEELRERLAGLARLP